MMAQETGMYFQGDIENVLNGLAFTAQKLAINDDQRQGFQAALLAVAGSFGLRPFEKPSGMNHFYVDRKRCRP